MTIAIKVRSEEYRNLAEFQQAGSRSGSWKPVVYSMTMINNITWYVFDQEPILLLPWRDVALEVSLIRMRYNSRQFDTGASAKEDINFIPRWYWVSRKNYCPNISSSVLKKSRILSGFVFHFSLFCLFVCLFFRWSHDRDPRQGR